MLFKLFRKTDTLSKSLPDRLIYYCLGLVIFLIPLFFFPWSVSVLELNKMLLFYLLVLIAFLIWLINSVFKKELVLKMGFGNTLVIIFGFIYLIAALFSQNRFLSFMGSPLSHGSFLAILFFIIFYFLIANTVKENKESWQLLRLALYSGMLIVIFNFAQLFGVHILPFDFAQNNAFNLVANSVSILVIYLVTMFIVGFGFFLKSKNKADRIFSEVFLLLVFALLFFLDQNLGWYLMIFSFFTWLIFNSMQSKKLKAVWIVLPTVLIVICLAFLFFSTTDWTLLNPALEIKIDFQNAWQITKSSLANSFILGSGPETYHYAFSSYRPESFNDSLLWQLRFDRSYSELFQLIATVGFFASLAFVVMPVWYLIKIGRKTLFSESVEDDWVLSVVLFTALLVVFLSSFFHSFSTTTALLFWFLLGLSATLLNKKEKKLDLQKSSNINLGFSLAFAVLLIGTVSFLYFGVRIWLGDYYLAKSQRVIADSMDYSQAVEYLEKGTNNSPWLAASHLSLANGLLAKASDALQQNNTNEARGILQEAESEAGQAILKEPKNVVSYERAGEVYQLINSVGGLEEKDKITETYEQALLLDPNNALLNLTLGTLYLVKAQAIQSEMNSAEDSSALNNDFQSYLQKAETQIRKATELKSNYSDAEVLYAQTLELEGKRPEAKSYLDEALKNDSANLALLEESGKLLLADEELEQAQARFQTILTLSPYHANARYWLASIYEKQGKKDEAIKELEQVLATNPGNSLVTEKLSQLKGE